MPLLLWAPPTGQTIEAGYAVLSLTPVGASIPTQRVIVAGYAILRLSPETASVTGPAVVVPVVPPTAEELLDAAVITTHAPRARLITLSDTREVLTTYNPTTITLTGSVTYDRRREVRRSAGLTVVDTALAPTAYGQEFAVGELLQVDRGIRVSGQNLYTLLGIYEITSFETSMAGTLSLNAEDPSVALRQSLGEVVVIPAGTAAAEVVRMLWEPVLGASTSWTLDGAGMGVTETRTLSEDDERLHAAVQLMADLGLELYLSRMGYPVLAPLTDPTTLPVSHTYRQAAGEALATDIRRSGDRQPYNRQVVIGESPTGSVVRSVYDVTDKTSPVHADRIGLRVAPIHRSASITTQHQADAVCHAKLIEAATWSDGIVWVGVPDPRIEAGEVIEVVDEQTGTNARYRLDSVTLPVTQGAMQLQGSRVLPIYEAA